MAIKHVLVVDDALTELVYLSEILSQHGYAVRTASNGEEAMRSLAEHKPDAILMDVVMPGQNGYQLTRALSKDPAYSAIPWSFAPASRRSPTASGACARGRATTWSNRSAPSNCSPA